MKLKPDSGAFQPGCNTYPTVLGPASGWADQDKSHLGPTILSTDVQIK